MDSSLTDGPSRRNRNDAWGTLSKFILIVTALAAIAMLVAPGGWLNPGPVSNVAAGKPAPTLDLVELIGDHTANAANGAEASFLKGQPQAGMVTLLHFWGTWCPPCRAEYPELVELVKSKVLQPHFQFISVSCEAGGGETLDGLRSKTEEYYQSLGLESFKTYADATGATRTSVAELLGKRGMMYPTSILIGPDQRVSGVWQGYSPESLDEMKKEIERLAQ